VKRAAIGQGAILIMLASLAAIVHACGDPSHIYEGRQFDESRKCLLSKSSLDVVEGDRPAECEARCLIATQRAADGSRAVYVATMCAPYPFGFDAGGGDPSCAPALAATARKDSCLSDGGSTNPRPAPSDAGDGG